MSDNIKIIRVFIASPGGLEDERLAVRKVVNEVNLCNSEHWGCQLKLVGWEDTIPGYQRPQDKINEDLDKCDYFLGILWDRWGSNPSAVESIYTSGFHEEISRARQRIESGQMKDLAIYFKKIQIPQGMIPGDDIQKVLDFRQECIDEKRVFFKEFDSIERFHTLVFSKLMEIGWVETELVQGESQGSSRSERAPHTLPHSEGSDTQNFRLIDEDSCDFISEVSQRPAELGDTKPHEIARFRLIASAISRNGNDDSYLGNHDANLIFRYLRNIPLPEREVRGLIDCGIVGFSYQNLPLWHWISKAEQSGYFFSRVRVLAALGNEQEKKNAIQIMQLAEQPIPSLNDTFDKKRILTSWLSDDTDSQTFDAVISFLSSNAESDDISLLEEVSSISSSQRQARVEAAIVGILSRVSADAALIRLVEKEVDKVEDEVVDVLFKSPQSLTTETVKLCLSAKTDGVRIRSVQLLFERDEITLEAATTLLTDSSHEIRLIAAERLKQLGHELDNDLIKRVLTIKKSPSVFGYGLLQRKETDTTYYEHYLSSRLAELDLSTLQEKVAKAGVFAEREISVLYSKFRSKMQDTIRVNLSDSFKCHFDTAFKKLESAGQVNPKILSDIKNLETSLRKQLCENSLTVLCDLVKNKDLHLVRKTVDEFEIAGTSSILKYFARFGDWSDIERIKKLGVYPNDRVNLLQIHKIQLSQEMANTIFSLGKSRIADLLALELDSTIRKSLAKRLPKKAIVGLNDDILKRELNRKDDEYRIIMALRCVQSLSKSRVTTLLDQYVVSDDYRYYNSIHWLDLGASLPQRLGKIIAERALAHH